MYIFHSQDKNSVIISVCKPGRGKYKLTTKSTTMSSVYLLL